MKKLFVVLEILGVSVVAGSIIYLNRLKTPPAPGPLVESSSAETVAPAQPEKIAVSKPETPKIIFAGADKLTQVPAAAPAANEMKPEDAVSPVHKAVDALLSAKSVGEKHELFQQLIKSGQIGAAIAELKQRAADNPDNVQLSTTLGEALINKVGALYAAGGDRNEMGILAMQADQGFNAALKIDPQNWEANFVKASSMYYWPADAATDNDVVQRLAGLIDQQETMSVKPEFAQTYVVLGNEYQKIGQSDKAVATWQLGLTKFPGDPALQKKVSGQ